MNFMNNLASVQVIFILVQHWVSSVRNILKTFIWVVELVQMKHEGRPLIFFRQMSKLHIPKYYTGTISVYYLQTLHGCFRVCNHKQAIHFLFQQAAFKALLESSPKSLRHISNTCRQNQFRAHEQKKSDITGEGRT